jgi:hypothetical protein
MHVFSGFFGVLSVDINDGLGFYLVVIKKVVYMCCAWCLCNCFINAGVGFYSVGTYEAPTQTRIPDTALTHRQH